MAWWRGSGGRFPVIVLFLHSWFIAAACGRAPPGFASSSGLVPEARQLTSGSCPNTCYSRTCDFWSAAANGGWTCAENEASYGCDCSGCTCANDVDDDSSTADDAPDADDSGTADDAPDAGDSGNNDDACASSCYGVSCDDWETYTCFQLEYNGCDCSGCECPNDSTSADCGADCCDSSNGALDSYGTGCEVYNVYPEWCGAFDDADFSSSSMCCVCGGGAQPTSSPTATGSPTSSQNPTIPPTFCADTNGFQLDSGGDGCDAYMPNVAWCGNFDDSDFVSTSMCCVCGGGSTTRSPTSLPSVSMVPTGTFSPTQTPYVVRTYNALVNKAGIDGAVINVANDITIPVQIAIRGGCTVRMYSTINAVLSGGSTSRLFYLETGASLTLAALRLTDGYDELKGGAVAAEHASLTMTSSILSASTANFGGAVFLGYSSSGVFVDSTFESNSVFYSGGGVYSFDTTTVTFTNVFFEDNEATGEGGAFACETAVEATVENCEFKSNAARYFGGAVSLRSSTALFAATSFDSNYAIDGDGGAVNNAASQTTLLSCTFSDNTAAWKGGAATGAGFLFENSSFFQNTAWSFGGAMSGSGEFVHSTFDSNESPFGGAIHATGTATFTACHFVNCFASEEGAAMYSTAAATLSDCIISDFDDASDARRLLLASRKLVSTSRHIFYHDTSSAMLVLALDTVTFENNDMNVLFSDESNVMMRNCHGLSSSDTISDGTLIQCAGIGEYCPAEYCTDVGAGVSVRDTKICWLPHIYSRQSPSAPVLLLS